MDVSVVLPTHNRSGLLALALRSALAQRDVDFEVLVVDDASDDDTSAMLTAFGDPRVRVIRHDSCQGVSAARNRGIAAARARWVAFLDDDDLWAPDKLALQVQAAGESRAGWVYVGHVNINTHYRVTGGAPPLSPDAVLKELPRRNVVPGGCSGVMASIEALAASGTFDPQLQPLADWDLWLRLARVGVPACVPRPLVAYRVHGQQMSLDSARVEADFNVLAERNREGSPAALYRYLGWWALRVKNHRDALRLFARGWLERRPDYPTAVFAADLTSLAGDILQHRFGIPLPSKSSGALSEEHRSWRREGQAWVDALVGAKHENRERAQTLE
jgi:glycosyltransferase involved in cell wall biosynthesis